MFAGKVQRPMLGYCSLCQQCRVHSSQHTAIENNVLYLHTRVHRKRRWALWENQWVTSSNPGFQRGEFKHIFFYFSTVIPEPVGCQSDEDCSRNEACNFGNCINPCVTSNPCSSNAACFVENHKAQCKCPPGFTGDPFRRCVQSKSAAFYNGWLKCLLIFALLFSKVKTGECQHDDECPSDKACIENYCVDPCETDPCGKNAICRTSNHIPVCRCPEDWGGNPHQECFQCRFKTFWAK